MSKLPQPFPKILPSSLLLLLIILPFKVISQSTDTERTILLNLKQQLGNPPSIESWNSSSSPCDWPEIKCNNGTVTGIILRDKKPIPATICDIENLSELDLALNYIPGEFPKDLYKCSKLRILDLSQNYFVGPIPADVDNLSANLRHIDLGANNFSGDIPVAMGRLPELRSLFLYQNEFNGTYPIDGGLPSCCLRFNRIVRSVSVDCEITLMGRMIRRNKREEGRIFGNGCGSFDIFWYWSSSLR